MSVIDVNLTVTGTVESLHLEPGDRIIVTLDQHVGQKEISALAHELKAVFAPHEVVILANGLRVAKEAAA